MADVATDTEILGTGADSGAPEIPHAEPPSGADGNPEADAPPPYELTAPEDYPINAGALQGLNDMCKTANLDEAQGKAVMAYMRGNYATAMAAQREGMRDQARQWIGEFQADSEFGGDRFDASLADARKALATFDTGGAVGRMLTETGYGNNPEVLRIFARVGRALGEDKLVGNGGNGAEDKPLEDRFYTRKP